MSSVRCELRDIFCSEMKSIPRRRLAYGLRNKLRTHCEEYQLVYETFRALPSLNRNNLQNSESRITCLVVCVQFCLACKHRLHNPYVLGHSDERIDQELEWRTTLCYDLILSLHDQLAWTPVGRATTTAPVVAQRPTTLAVHEHKLCNRFLAMPGSTKHLLSTKAPIKISRHTTTAYG